MINFNELPLNEAVTKLPSHTIHDGLHGEERIIFDRKISEKRWESVGKAFAKHFDPKAEMDWRDGYELWVWPNGFPKKLKKSG